MNTLHSHSIDELRTLLSYSPETGEFRWLKPPPNAYSQRKETVGTFTTGDNGKCYRYVTIDAEGYTLSHIAWAFMTGEWPKRNIRYQDGDPMNLRWENLRLATEPAHRLKHTRKSGLRYIHVIGKRFQVAIYLSGRPKMYCGVYNTLEEAVRVRDKAMQELGVT